MITYSDELGSTQKPGIVIVLLSFDFLVPRRNGAKLRKLMTILCSRKFLHIPEK